MDPNKFILLCLAGWLNREQQAVIDYQREEIRVLKEILVRPELMVSINLFSIRKESETTDANSNRIEIELEQGCGQRIQVRMRRYVNQPKMDSSWNYKRKNRSEAYSDRLSIEIM